MTTQTSTDTEGHSCQKHWLHFEDGKCFSRLLYTNPVCLLTTLNLTDCTKPTRNVMVISWLTAINNNGKFVMSLNKRRHTASVLVPTGTPGRQGHQQHEFVLCVPIAGMENLLRNIGKMSARWGSSKFPRDHLSMPSHNHEEEKSAIQIQKSMSSSTRSTSTPTNTKMSFSCTKNKRKKFENGIEGLHAVKIGESDIPASDYEQFGIFGTVAHLKCKTNGIVDNEDGSDVIDDDHYLIFAEVTDAYVRKDYWNEKKKQFQPIELENAEGVSPPYLTFFGSQSFGYVIPYKE